MEKRAIIAIVLSVLVLLAFRYVEQQYLGRTSRELPPAQKRTLPPPPQAQQQPEPKPSAQPEPPPLTAEDTKAEAETVVVNGSLYRAVLDNRGAVLTSWELRQYEAGEGNEFQMIAANHVETRPFPGSVIFSDPSLTELANGEFYQVTAESKGYSSGSLSPPVTVTMVLKRGDLAIEKHYRFQEDNYLVDVTASFKKGGEPLAGQFLLGQDIGPEREHLVRRSGQLQAVYYSDGKVRRENPPKEPNQVKKTEGNVRWVGLDMQYFTSIAIPSHPLSSFEIEKVPVTTVGLDGKEVDRDLLRLTIPTQGSLQYQVYLGPKKRLNLEAVGAIDLTGVINYGMFSFLVFPLLFSLRWIYQFVSNYGVAIILLTCLLSLLLFPFRLKQMLSMKKMQAVQPKIKAIQDKYRRYKKTDPRRAEMNQEIMAIYKEHGVNPLGGCLPLLLQMPLLFAFYSLLANSIELRQAPFFGWIQDLSAKDPYYVLPLVMGLTMLVSQKMTPMTPGTDPTQTKIMTMVMPGVLTVMFLNVSSGLNLYFLCSNIFQVGFQKIAEKWLGDGASGGKPRSK